MRIETRASDSREPPQGEPAARPASVAGGTSAAGGTGQGALARLLALIAATRARRLLAAFAAGATLALSLPPFDLLPAVAAWSALLLVMMAGERRARRPLVERALLGAAFGFGTHLASLWWVGAAFLVDADVFGPLLPLGVVGLPLLLAPFHALALALVGFAPRTVAWRALALAAAVGGTEFLRGVVFTGFPWNAAGVQLTSLPVLAQGAALVGVAGLTPLAVLLGTLPALIATRRSLWLAGPVVIAFAALAAFGAHRLGSLPAPDPEAPAVRIVQPAVAQADKWDPAHRAEIWERLLSLTAGEGPGRAGVVLWPETAIPFLWRVPSVEQVDLAEALAGRTLVTGAVVVEALPAGRRAFNSVLVIDPGGTVRQRYDKVRLVPFGEFLPLAPFLSRIGLRALVENASDFSAGTERFPLDLPGLPPALPLICYEVIFPAGEAGPQVGLVVNVTNDAWFGDTPGPRQHLRHAQLRAIEGGIPVARAANNGISAMIDGAGRVIARLPLDVRGAFEAPLPPRVAAPYGRLGDWPLLAFLAAVLVAGVALSSRRRARDRRATRGS